MQFFKQFFILTTLLFTATLANAKEIPLIVKEHRFQSAPSIAQMDSLLSHPEIIMQDYNPKLPGMVSLKSVDVNNRHIVIKMSAMLKSIELSGHTSSLELHNNAECDVHYEIRVMIEGGTKARNVVYNNAKDLIGRVCFLKDKGILKVSGFYTLGVDPSTKLLHDQAVKVLRMQIDTIIQAIVDKV